MLKQFITAKEVSEIMGVSDSTAYKIIRQLNDQLKAKGYITVTGKVSRKFFEERVLYGATAEGD